MSQVFPPKQQRLDWQLIAEIEPMVVVMGAEEEIEKLKNVQSSLAFCSIENEFNKVINFDKLIGFIILMSLFFQEILENTRGLAKIFRLSQLTIQYMLHCQENLETDINTYKEQEVALKSKIEKMTEDYSCLMEEAKALRKEAKKRKRMLAAQQECMFKGKTKLKLFVCILMIIFFFRY